MRSKPFSIAFIVRDPLPPLRADVLTLFGAHMPRYGIVSDLVGQAGRGQSGAAWPGGAMHLVGSLGSRFASVLSPLWDTFGLLQAWRRARPDCIQVRDKIASGIVGRLAAAVLRVPFVYWMSFPIAEGLAVRRDEIGARRKGLLWLGHALRARLARAAIYRLVLPGARHLFVQSEAMAAWLAAKGLPRSRMTVVPMGVDTRVFDRAAIVPSSDPRLDGRRVLLYLGRVARSRDSGFLLEVADRLRATVPELLLVIAGDAASGDDMGWLRAQVAARGLSEHVLLTGWLPQAEALAYAVRAEVGLSPIPRGALFDVSSPTKLVEYMALGLPCVGNDIPDQRHVIEQSGAGLCATMAAAPFSDAVLALLADPALAARCAAAGPDWVRRHRSYEVLAGAVADAYGHMLAQR